MKDFILKALAEVQNSYSYAGSWIAGRAFTR